MERIIIHDLYRYKLIFALENEIKVSSNDNKELKPKTGRDNKIENILFQDPKEGWRQVYNPEVAFSIADNNHLKLSKNYLKRLKPSEAFFEKRKPKDNNEDKKRKSR